MRFDARPRRRLRRTVRLPLATGVLVAAPACGVHVSTLPSVDCEGAVCPGEEGGFAVAGGGRGRCRAAAAGARCTDCLAGSWISCRWCGRRPCRGQSSFGEHPRPSSGNTDRTTLVRQRREKVMWPARHGTLYRIWVTLFETRRRAAGYVDGKPHADQHLMRTCSPGRGPFLSPLVADNTRSAEGSAAIPAAVSAVDQDRDEHERLLQHRLPHLQPGHHGQYLDRQRGSTAARTAWRNAAPTRPTGRRDRPAGVTTWPRRSSVIFDAAGPRSISAIKLTSGRDRCGDGHRRRAGPRGHSQFRLALDPAHRGVRLAADGLRVPDQRRGCGGWRVVGEWFTPAPSSYRGASPSPCARATSGRCDHGSGGVRVLGSDWNEFRYQAVCTQGRWRR